MFYRKLLLVITLFMLGAFSFTNCSNEVKKPVVMPKKEPVVVVVSKVEEEPVEEPVEDTNRYKQSLGDEYINFGLPKKNEARVKEWDQDNRFWVKPYKKK
jgi:hypothetical protein